MGAWWEDLLKDFIKFWASKAWEELGYLCNYKRYVEYFEKEQEELLAKVESVERRIEEAKKRNLTEVKSEVEHWLKRANELLQDPEPTKCFGLCTNRHSQAHKLERLREDIRAWIAKVKELSEEVSDAAEGPGMEFYSQDFMPFESRKEKFKELKMELEESSNYMIGLQGMGGAGKSTMAKEVGKHVDRPNAFDRVILVEVSTLGHEKSRIQEDIAKKLGLELKEEKQWSHAQQIWMRIANAGKVLIILDDVWDEKFNLENIGIHHHRDHSKGRCCVLLTTRSWRVCTSMRCQKTVRLDELPLQDALNLFLYHATASWDDSYPMQEDPLYLKEVAEDIVNECGGLPVMIEAVAKPFQSLPPQQWQAALTALKNPTPSRPGIADEEKRTIYKTLRFSYDRLNDKEAQVIFLLCSVFPRSHEIPIELLSRIVIGLGLFGECVEHYDVPRSHVRFIINELINSSLLKKAGEEHVKVHDEIRKMALEMTDNEEIQEILDFSKTKLKEDVKYSSWIINGFPSCFDDSKLEALLVWINANDGSLHVPNAFFGGMKNLRVLLLHSKIELGRTSALSLPKSIQSLKFIRTLSLTNWELGDISVLMTNLQKLESLELTNCLIDELPNGIRELDKLRFLCLIRCSLKKNNPFEVIAKCSQLEELYYVSNDDHIAIGVNVPQDTCLPEYQIYHIDGSNFSIFNSSQLNTSIKKSFRPKKLQRIFSEKSIKSMAARAEILELQGDKETGWNDLIPGIVSIEVGAMKDLTKLSLKHWSEMKCLIHTKHLHLKSRRVTILSKLAELQLYKVDVREICYGPYPADFLKHLEKLELRSCKKLGGTLFKDNLTLGNLKSIEINDCSMTYLFHPSTAQTLRQLETLKIDECFDLKYIITDEGSLLKEKGDGKDPNPRSHDSIFPKLKLIYVKGCEELEFILPICFCEDLPLLERVLISQCRKLNYMFGHYPGEGELHQMRKENTLPSLNVISIGEVPSYENIYPECYLPQKSAPNTSEGSKAKDKCPSGSVSWEFSRYFWPTSKTTDEDEPSSSKVIDQLDQIAAQEKYVGNRAHGIFTPPLHPYNLRELKIKCIANLGSLFTASIASSMLLLEKLVVKDCDELEHIVIEEIDDHHRMNAYSIFPNLRTLEIQRCRKLKYVFPASCSINLLHLESMFILGAGELRYVFGNSCDDDNSPPKDQNINTEIHLPALIKLSLAVVPNMVSMCPENCHVKASSLNHIELGKCSQLPINSFIDLSFEGHTGQERLSRNKLMGMQVCSLKHLYLLYLEDMKTIYDLERFQITSDIVNSNLESLNLTNLDELRNICVGPENLHMSFQNIVRLKIVRCNQLKFIFSASISTSLPYLRYLWVRHCEELERIIQENNDDEEECCFPNLRTILVGYCKRLKCLFSVSTRATLPQLSYLHIENAPEVEQVFGAASQELHINQVFPKLFMIIFEKLPKLHTICSGIDFQSMICREVNGCPNISLTSTDTKFLKSYWDWFEEFERNKGNVIDEFHLLERYLDRVREATENTIKRNQPTAQQNNGSIDIKEIAEASDEENPESEADGLKDSKQTNKPIPLAAPSRTESPQSERGLHLHSEDPELEPYEFSSSSTSSQIIEETVKPTSQEGSQGKVVMTNLSELHMSDQYSMVEAQAKKVELEKKIAKFQAELAELNSKGKEIEGCEIKPLSLQEQKKKSVSDT